jgi:hypothetical protein
MTLRASCVRAISRALIWSARLPPPSSPCATLESPSTSAEMSRTGSAVIALSVG